MNFRGSGRGRFPRWRATAPSGSGSHRTGRSSRLPGGTSMTIPADPPRGRWGDRLGDPLPDRVGHSGRPSVGEGTGHPLCTTLPRCWRRGVRQETGRKGFLFSVSCSAPFPGLDNEGHRTVVYERDLHVSLEYAGCHGETPLPEKEVEPFIQSTPLRRGGGAVE